MSNGDERPSTSHTEPVPGTNGHGKGHAQARATPPGKPFPNPLAERIYLELREAWGLGERNELTLDWPGNQIVCRVASGTRLNTTALERLSELIDHDDPMLTIDGSKGQIMVTITVTDWNPPVITPADN